MRKSAICAHRTGEPDIADSIERTIAFLSDAIHAIDAAVETLIASAPETAQRRDLIDSVPRHRRHNANVLLAGLPEIGRMGTRKLRSLSASLPQMINSAERRFHATSPADAHTRARPSTRPRTGYRHNPALKALYQRIRAQGKSHTRSP